MHAVTTRYLVELLELYSHLWNKDQNKENCCQCEDSDHKYSIANIDVVHQGKGHQCHHHNHYARDVDDGSYIL